jgi:tetratricopeptide (TPR) repeat protein
MAEQQNQLGLQMARDRGQRRQIGHGLIVESELAHARGHLDQAEALAQEALAIWEEVGAQTNVAYMRALLGTLRYEQGNLAAAESVLQESLALSERLSDRFGITDASLRLGHLARLQGRDEQAITAYERSLKVTLDMESLAGTPEALDGLAVVLLGSSETERAMRLAALAHAIRLHTGAARAPYHDAWVRPVMEALERDQERYSWERATAAYAAFTTTVLRKSVRELIPL